MPLLPVIYINLDRRDDRRGFMEDQLRRLGISAERLPALAADAVPDALLAPHRDRDNPFAITSVEVACRMSHEGAWQRIVASGAAAGLVLEDDAVLGDSLKLFLDPDLPVRLDADLIKLETFREPVLLGREVERLGSRFAVRRLCSSHMGGAAYIISARLARRALADPQRATMSLDQYLFARAGGIVARRGVYQVDPAPAVQLERLRGDGPEEMARGALAASDLRRLRAAQRRTAPRSFPRWLRKHLAEARYTLTVARALLEEPEARRGGRRPVPFDPGA